VTDHPVTWRCAPPSPPKGGYEFRIFPLAHGMTMVTPSVSGSPDAPHSAPKWRSALIAASGGARQLEAEYPIVLRRELECIDPSLKPPPLTAALAMVGCLRAIPYIKSGKTGETLRLHRRVRHPRALVLIARWVLAQIFPGRFHVAPRIPVVNQ